MDPNECQTRCQVAEFQKYKVHRYLNGIGKKPLSSRRFVVTSVSLVRRGSRRHSSGRARARRPTDHEAPNTQGQTVRGVVRRERRERGEIVSGVPLQEDEEDGGIVWISIQSIVEM